MFPQGRKARNPDPHEGVGVPFRFGDYWKKAFAFLENRNTSPTMASAPAIT